MVDEGQIAGKPFTRLYNSWGSQCVEDHTNFNPLAFILQLENAQYGLIKSPSGLNDIVVNGINRRIYGNTDGEVWMEHFGPSCDYLVADKGTSIAQNMYGRLWQFVPANGQYINK